MARLLNAQSVELLKTLLEKLGRVEGGELDIGAFSAWFRSLRWDSSIGFNTPYLAPLGWAIETSLFEYEEYPHLYSPSDLRDAVNTVLAREGYEPVAVTLGRWAVTFAVYPGARGTRVIRRSLHQDPLPDPPETPPIATVTIPA